jgi:hypothetical protein
MRSSLRAIAALLACGAVLSTENTVGLVDLSSEPATMPSPRFGASMAYIGDDRMLLVGGRSAGALLTDAWTYDILGA